MRSDGFKHNCLRAFGVAASALITLFGIGGCGASSVDSSSPRVLGGIVVTPNLDEATLAAEEAALSSMPAPQGVGAHTWNELTSTFIESLRNRNASEFPSGSNNDITDLQIDEIGGSGEFTLSWTYHNRGDYDLNGEVNISDLSTLGQHFQARSTDPDWPSAQKADGDDNGEVNLADVTSIGSNFHAQVGGYHIYGGASEGGPWTEVGDVPQSEGDFTTFPAKFIFQLGPATHPYYLVMPYDFAELDGIGVTSPIAPCPPLPPSMGVLKDGVIFLGQQPGGLPPVIGQTETTLTLRGDRSGDILPGAVVITNVGLGALRKVISVSANGDTTVLETELASLTDAFSDLDMDIDLPFNEAAVGDLVSTDPTVTFEWESASETSSASSKDASVDSAVKLKAKFGESPFEATGDVKVTGEASLEMFPSFIIRVREDGNGDTVIDEAIAACSPELTFTVSVAANGGVAFSPDPKVWVEKFLRPVTVGYLVFLPKLKVESGVSGSLGGVFKGSATGKVNGNVAMSYDPDRNDWDFTQSMTPTMTSEVTDATGAASMELTVLSASLEFLLYNAAGPFAQVAGKVTGTGTLKTEGGRTGVEVKVEGSAAAELGLKAQLPEFLPQIFESDWVPVSFPFESTPLQIFGPQFFPFQTITANLTASTTVVEIDEEVTFDASGSTASEGSIESFSWDFGDGTVVPNTTQSQVAGSYPDPGVYTVIVTVKGNLGGSGTDSVEITVNPPAPEIVANFTFSPDPFPGIPSAFDPITVSFDASSSTNPNGTIVEYAWFFSDFSPIETTASPFIEHTYTIQPGTGASGVTLQVTGSDGATATFTHPCLSCL